MKLIVVEVKWIDRLLALSISTSGSGAINISPETG
jgi:hypothetical protein